MDLAHAIEQWVHARGDELPTSLREDIDDIADSVGRQGFAHTPCADLDDDARQSIAAAAAKDLDALKPAAVAEFLAVVGRWAADRDDEDARASAAATDDDDDGDDLTDHVTAEEEEKEEEEVVDASDKDEASQASDLASSAIEEPDSADSDDAKADDEDAQWSGYLDDEDPIEDFDDPEPEDDAVQLAADDDDPEPEDDAELEDDEVQLAADDDDAEPEDDEVQLAADEDDIDSDDAEDDDDTIDEVDLEDIEADELDTDEPEVEAASSFFETLGSSPAKAAAFSTPVLHDVTAETPVSETAAGAFSDAAQRKPSLGERSVDWITVGYFTVAAICFALVIVLYWFR